MVFVPTPAAMLDFASTLQFAGLVAETIETYNKSNIYPNIPDIRFFITSVIYFDKKFFSRNTPLIEGSKDESKLNINYGRGILMISDMVEMVATVMPLDHLLVWRLTVMIISKNLKNI